jgi:hypothetical protein
MIAMLSMDRRRGTYGWFHGDAVHAHEGRAQILARILEKYFGP